MSAIDDLFQRLRGEGRKAFMPFLTAGDPDLEFTSACLRELDQAGCDLIELGIPYSDPIADGPVIQASYTRALDAGVRLDRIFESVAGVAPQLNLPLVTMASYAILFRTGLEAYLDRAQAAGISGAIVPDMPVDEADPFAELCRDRDFSLIQLITPTTPPRRVEAITRQTTGFIYYVSITGITGERQELPDELVGNLESLRQQTDLPICVGFGISRPDQARLLRSVADGVIVGSAIVRRVAACSVEGRPREEVLGEIRQFATEMIAALND